MSEKIAGIYEIRNRVNGHRYVGQSVRIDLRRYLHFWNLKKGRHDATPLQRAFRKYGVEAFSFRVIERVSIAGLSKVKARARLTAREQHHMDRTPPDKSYNVSPAAGSMLGHKHKPKTIANMRAAAQKHKRVGWKHSAETIAKMVKAARQLCAKPETRAKKSAAMKRMWQRADYRAEMSTKVARTMRRPAKRAASAAQSLRNWNNPATRAAMIAGNRKAKGDPAARTRNGEASRRRWADPDYRKKAVANIQRARRDPAVVKKHRRIMGSPAMRAKLRASAQAGQAIKSERRQAQLLDFLAPRVA